MLVNCARIRQRKEVLVIGDPSDVTFGHGGCAE